MMPQIIRVPAVAIFSAALLCCKPFPQPPQRNAINRTEIPAITYRELYDQRPFLATVLDSDVHEVHIAGQDGTIVYVLITVRKIDGTNLVLVNNSPTGIEVAAAKNLKVGKEYRFPDVLKR